MCWTQRAVCPSPCHVLGTRAEGPSPCAASSTACAVSAPPTERPRGLESPGVRRGRTCEHPLRPSVPALGPGLPLGLQSKTRPHPQGAHGLAGALSDRSTRDLRARRRQHGWGQPGRCLWRRHLAATREAGAWGRGQPLGNTWWPLGPAGGWARGGRGASSRPVRGVPRSGPLTFEHLAVAPEQRLQAAALPPQPPQRLPAQLARHFCQGKALCGNGAPPSNKRPITNLFDRRKDNCSSRNPDP